MSTRSFLNIVADVLIEQPEISELPNDQLNAFNFDGDIIEEDIPLNILLKIARLQTLIMQTREKAEMPDYETTRQIANETGVDFVTAGASALAISEDATQRVIMLERLIVEVVREVFPKECNQFNVRYLARLDTKILRLPVLQNSFLD